MQACAECGATSDLRVCGRCNRSVCLEHHAESMRVRTPEDWPLGDVRDCCLRCVRDQAERSGERSEAAYRGREAARQLSTRAGQAATASALQDRVRALDGRGARSIAGSQRGYFLGTYRVRTGNEHHGVKWDFVQVLATVDGQLHRGEQRGGTWTITGAAPAITDPQWWAAAGASLDTASA